MEPNKESNFLSQKPQDFLIVGLGASAGGIGALQEFFQHVPHDSGMAYVVILHLSPDHDSQLAGVLQTVTPIPVTKVTEKVAIEPDHIYVVPPNQHLVMEDGFVAPSLNLYLEERRAPVDIFLRTLADSHGPRAIGVILSGTGANGSMGLKRIKERGGAVYVQNPREAEFNEMPRNAIATELIDQVLPVAQIPSHLLAYRNSQGTVEISLEPEQRPQAQQQALREIFTQLRQRTGHDFSNYKRPTLMRRIERRINVRHLPDLPSYAAFLGQHVEESQALLKDLLISVTNFFRDKKPFSALEHDVLPALLRDKTAEDEVRIWVAGCATGEEAYSLAMLLAERTWGIIDAPKVQLFATDIDEAAIAQAREGFYTLNDAADVSSERLMRFFRKEGDSYRVIRELREMILFAHHNFLKDPPFSRLDLVSCRNVLIYLNATAQERVMETFHFALKPGGYLFLGSAESVDGASDLYAIVSREHHIYQARPASLRHYPVPESVPQSQPRQPLAVKTPEGENRPPSRLTFGELHQKLLEQYAPPSLVVSEEYEIVHMSEKAGRFLEFSGGEPTRNLLKLIKTELRLELRSALYQATQQQTPTQAHIGWMQQGEAQYITIHVKPVLKEGDPAKGFLLVLFEPGKPDQNEEKVVLTANEPIARQLEEELIGTKAQLRQSAEQYEYQAEELKASNEELQAMNEELRSAAEELETSKEELQSINEELRTVNQELKVKIEEISLTGNNLQNLINSADVATIFLDRAFCTRLYTPAARHIFNLIPSDYGRPISDITHRLAYTELLADAQAVLEKLTVIEREVATTDGRAFMMRILPYRTSEDRINGVVMTFFDVTQRKRAEEAMRASEEKYRTLFNSIDEGFNLLEMIEDESGQRVDFRIVETNPAWEQQTGLRDATGKTLLEIAPHFEPELLDFYRDVVLSGKGRRMEYYTASTDRWYTVYASRSGGEGSRQVAVVFNDITERKQQEQQQEFLLKLSDALRTELDAEAIANRALQMLVGHLQLDRSFIGEYLLAEDRGAFPYQVGNNRVPPLPAAGVRLTDFPDALRIASDETLIITDLQNTEGLTQADKQNLGALGFGALLVATIRKGEKNPLWAISAVSARPRRWRQSEIKLVEEVAERTWTAMDRARTQEALRHSEEKFRTLFETIDEGFGLIEVLYGENGAPYDHRILESNPAFDRNTGLKNPQGRLASELMPGLERYWNELYAGVLETGKTIREEIHSDAFDRWFDVLVSSVGTRAPHQVAVTFSDITMRRRQEEALRESEESFRTYVSASFDVVYTMSADWKTMYQLEGKGFIPSTHNNTFWLDEYIPDHEKGRVTSAIKEAIRDKKIFELEHQVIDADGKLSWTYSRAIPRLDEQGALIEWIGAATNITHRKEAEAALRESEEKYRTIFETIDEGFTIQELLVDEQGQVIDLIYREVNEAYARHSGIKNALGKKASELFLQLEQSWIDAMTQVYQTGEPVRMEGHQADVNRWFTLQYARVGGPGSKLISVVFNNITDRKQREREQEFLLKLGDALRPLSDAVEIQREAARVIGEDLGVDRAYYCDIESDDEHWVVADNYVREGVPPLISRGRIDDFGWAGEQMRAGKMLRISDVNTDPNLSKSARTEFQAVNVTAAVSIPLVKEGRWAANFTLQYLSPHEWSEAEIKLAQEVAERTWSAVERAKAEATLRESEEQFRRALEEAPIPVIMHTEDGEVLQISRSWTELTGYSLQDVPSFDHWLTQAYGAGADQVRSHMQTLFKGHARTLNIDFPVLTRTGELRHWSFSASSPGTLRDGRRFIVGMALDITERKQAQQQLEQFNTLLERQIAERTQQLKGSNDLLQSVFDTTLFGLAVLKAEREENGAITDFRIQLVNPQLEQLTGRADLVDKLYGEVYPGIKQTGLFDRMLQVLQTGEPAQLEYHYGHDGFDAWFSSMFVKMDNGLVATNLDITERKKTEAENEKHFHILQQSEQVARMGSWEYDISSGVFTWSEGMYRLFGLPQGQPVHPEIYLDYALEEDRPIAERIVQALRENRLPLEETLRVQVQGQVLTLKIIAQVLGDEQGEPVKVLGVDLDLTELKRLEEENVKIRLEQQQELLNAILEAQEEERRRISESLHNGVGQILYATKLNLAGVQLGDGREGNGEAVGAFKKVEALLTEAIVETRRVSHELVPALLKDFGLKKAIEGLCGRFADTGLELECHCFRERLAQPLEMALYRIAQELINNIIKHAGASRALLEVSKDKDYVYIEVRDNGKGFDTAQLEGHRPGGGIGLRTIRDRVKLLNGTLEVESSPGRGTFIAIRVPLPPGRK